MDNLSQVEVYLDTKGVPYQKIKGALMLKSTPGARPPVWVRQERHGWVELMASFTLGERATATIGLERLLFEIEKRLGPAFQFGFDPKDKTFFLKRTFSNYDVEEEVGNFLVVSDDVLLPLFNHVKENGEWDNALISLAFDPMWVA